MGLWSLLSTTDDFRKLSSVMENAWKWRYAWFPTVCCDVLSVNGKYIRTAGTRLGCAAFHTLWLLPIVIPLLRR